MSEFTDILNFQNDLNMEFISTVTTILHLHLSEPSELYWR